MKDFRLYAITGEQFHPGRDLIDVMEQAILGGVDIIQLRDKTGSRDEVLAKAQALRALTRKHNVAFIVNDYIDIAMESDADGVHLGQGDLSLAEARKIVGDKMIGISTHAIEEALLAEAQGADYIGVGPVFPTKTKVDVVDPVTVNYVRQVSEQIRIPFVAIGGIKLHNVDEVIAAGATRICAVSEIVGSSNVKETCEAFLRKLERGK
ncbi:thiamine phosphate synthase [Paenibacillus sp. GCM10012307]|uniref:Thiamine-phosphate synthase n=1 Tax=Paenibacillus roseus TaxID=2798579 RepID=A0A934MMV7_9BACL|nr:thiamine phosphate synthase [Paenibacillus roseus]MBJ6360341.1 thiamine phosphate synthase [Paenibacillus roseus]